MAGTLQRLGFCLLLLVSGCALVRVDVTDQQQYPTDYRAGQVFRLKQALTLEHPAGTLSFSEPELHRHTVHAERVIGVVDAGTTLRVTRVLRGRYPGLESWGEVYGEILDGPFRGRSVELTAISRQVPQQQPPIRMPWVDPDLLEPSGE